MNKLTTAKRTQVIAALVEGNSVRAACRMTDVAKGTVLKLLVDLGMACAAYQDRTIRNLRTTRGNLSRTCQAALLIGSNSRPMDTRPI